MCLNSTAGCKIQLAKKGKAITVSINQSRCSNIQKFNLKQAAEFSERSPCTNHPIQCPICPKDSLAVWKYNLQSHIRTEHPTATVGNYKALINMSDDERTLMKAVYLVKPRMSSKQKRKVNKLVVSMGHSTRMVMRSVMC